MNYNSCGDIQNTLFELAKRPNECSFTTGSADLTPVDETSRIFQTGATLTRSIAGPVQTVRQSLADEQPNVPEEFDWTTQKEVKAHMDGNLINQGNCGSCWSIATATSIGDRYVVALSARGYKIRKPLSASAVQLLSCKCLMSNEPPANICTGGNVEVALSSLQSKDLVVSTDKCFPYPQQLLLNRNLLPTAPNVSWKPNTVGDGTMACINFNNPSIQGCQAGIRCAESLVKLSVSENSVHTYPDSSYFADLKRDIYTNGPIPTSFIVMDGFVDFWKKADKNASYDINDWSQNKIKGGHAVVIVGWTKDSWIIRNSWGATHGRSWYCNVKFNNDIGVGIATTRDFPGMMGSFYGGAVSFIPDLSPEKVQALVDTGYIEGDSPLNLGGLQKDKPSSTSHNFWIVGGVLGIVVVAIAFAISNARKNKKRKRRN